MTPKYLMKTQRALGDLENGLWSPNIGPTGSGTPLTNLFEVGHIHGGQATAWSEK
jgi:hypothetical protein